MQRFYLQIYSHKIHAKFSTNSTLAVPIPRIQTVQDLSVVTRPKSHDQNLTSHTQILSDIKILFFPVFRKQFLFPVQRKEGTREEYTSLDQWPIDQDRLFSADLSLYLRMYTEHFLK